MWSFTLFCIIFSFFYSVSTIISIYFEFEGALGLISKCMTDVIVWSLNWLYILLNLFAQQTHFTENIYWKRHFVVLFHFCSRLVGMQTDLAALVSPSHYLPVLLDIGYLFCVTFLSDKIMKCTRLLLSKCIIMENILKSWFCLFNMTANIVKVCYCS